MWWTEETRDKARLAAFMHRDRLYAAYALADLEPKLFPHCRWFMAGEADEEKALGLYFTGLTPHAFLAMGDAAGLGAILERCFCPTEAYFITPPGHMAVIAQRYGLASTHDMIRMYMPPGGFQPVPGPAIRLEPAHLSSLQELYAWGNVYGFSGYQLQEGLFYGLFQGDQLVASAGTHVLAPDYGIAAVGNVFTHPDHRGRGYATICTSAVTQGLLDLGLDVVLNVAADNPRATQIYRRLGYREHCHFYETLARAQC